MSVLVFPIIAIAAIFLALALAYLPMRIVLMHIARQAAAPIREFMRRQRDRRAMERASPDRRKL